MTIHYIKSQYQYLMLDKFGQDVFVEGSGEVALEQLVVEMALAFWQ